MYMPNRPKDYGQKDRSLRHLAADYEWEIHQLEAEKEKEYLGALELPSGTDDLYEATTSTKNIFVAMRDGIRLCTDIYLPAEEKDPLPVILFRLPYGKNEAYCAAPAEGRFWAKKGYAVVIQDVRGKFDSEGNFNPGTHEVNDGYDTLEWIANQPWCKGNVGVAGDSYYGLTTLSAGACGHPALKCIAPSVTAMDGYKWFYRNGALWLQMLGGWAIKMAAQTYQNVCRLDPWHLPLVDMAREADISSSIFNKVVANPTRNEAWRKEIFNENLTEQFAKIKVPAYHFAGWYDNFLQSSLSDWQTIRKAAGNAEHKRIVIGPWDHNYTAMDIERVGRIAVGASATLFYDFVQAFFDHYLKGLDNGFDREAPVKLYVMGDNAWRSEQEWPLARTQFTKYYLHSNGKANTLEGDGFLDTEPPTSELPDSYVYDPDDPVADTLELDGFAIAGEMRDRRVVEVRNDVLVYSSNVLGADLELTGPITATLFAASSAVDTDFTVTLVDVFPDGYANLIQDGIIRASYRKSEVNPSPIEPDRIYMYEVDLWATSYVVQQGHKVRVEVSSSCFNKYDRNPNTGEPFGTATGTIRADQTIHHSREYPSHIVLPVIPR